ncbi:MAG: hypothetical protein U1C71_02575, partial [archaeon]|nr:hypothetical protein [archaeon]
MVRKLNGQNHANGNGNARVTDGPHTGDWLCVHRRHETPAVGRAILDFSRVANREHFMGRLLPFLRSYGERVSIGRNETITRKDLFELEKLVMQDDYGLESAILHVAPRNPYLAEVLGDPKAYTEFVENHVQVKKWK